MLLLGVLVLMSRVGMLALGPRVGMLLLCATVPRVCSSSSSSRPVCRHTTATWVRRWRWTWHVARRGIGL